MLSEKPGREGEHLDREGEHLDAVPADLIAEVLAGDADITRAGRAQAIHAPGSPTPQRAARGEQRSSRYGPLVLWAIQQWQKPDQALHLALDTPVRLNRYCVVVLSVVCHGGAIPLLWQTLEHPNAELLGWLEGRSRWRCVMRLRADA